MNPRTPIFRLPPFQVEAVLTTLPETIDWGISAYGVPPHWTQTHGQSIRVAILDTGIDREPS